MFSPNHTISLTVGADNQDTTGSKGVFGSTVFGGYDSSRIVHNNVTFSLAQDISRDIVVSLEMITHTYPNGTATPFLSSPLLTPIWIFIDSTTPFIYLPSAVCETFKKSLGLQWNSTYEMYLLDDTTHEILLKANPNIIFQISNSAGGGPTVDIVLPYASLDLTLNYPLIPGSLPTASPNEMPPSLRYFPLMQASNDSQYTLGRTFLQEA